MLRDHLSLLTRFLYAVPVLGLFTRAMVEARLGPRPFQGAAYWNASLKGWASSYLGGTISIDVRDYATIRVARQLAPGATSLLDLGCAGASLAVHLGEKMTTYVGVDISDVAIEAARKRVAEECDASRVSYELHVSSLGDFRPRQKFDVIVFNEVLYYLPLKEVESTLATYCGHLAEGGVIIVSLKDHSISRLVAQVIAKSLRFEYGVLFQQKPFRPSWKVNQDARTPAYLVQAYRPHSFPVPVPPTAPASVPPASSGE